MIEVEQRQLWRPDDDPDGPQFGDCFRACVASILELSYEDVPDLRGDNQALTDWLREVTPNVVALYRRLDKWGVETLDSWHDWPETHYEQGFWIATVHSKRIPDVEIFGCGCVERRPGGDPACEWCNGNPEARSLGVRWGLHAVVMQNARLAWDPHPERTGETGPFIGATTFVLTDPAPVLRALMSGVVTQ